VIDRIPEDAQTLHAEALGLLLALERERNWSHLSGSFSTKTVKGAEYVYFQYSDPGGKKRQFSLGRRGPELEGIVRGYAEGREQLGPDLARVERLAGLMRAAGLMTMPHGPARVVRSLADAGVFRLGGVLVGSYAFQILGNLLGVKWSSAAWRTQDVDIAGHLCVALPEVEADVPKALESLEMGFVPVPEFDREHASTSYRVRGESLQVDFITPGRESDRAPIHIGRFKTAAAPIEHLSLLMDEAQPALTLESTATLIVVPQPARFALHKLFVSQTRSTIQQTKAGKDLHQAALLLEVLAQDRPEDLEHAARAFSASGPAVTKKLLRALREAVGRWPETRASEEFLESILD